MSGVTRILALDTTTDACSVAVGDTAVRAARWEMLPRGHSVRLLPMITETLKAAGWTRVDIEAVAFARGPGSFTGIRIAAGAAQGLALALGCRVIPVSTLEALAEDEFSRAGTDAVAVAVDARMGEVYWGCFRRNEDGTATAVADECVAAPDYVALPEQPTRWTGIGSGFDSYAARLAERFGDRWASVHPDRLPDARHVWSIAARRARAGALEPPEAAIPVYIRNRVAARKKTAGR